MTIAIDKRTGAVVGQVCGRGGSFEEIGPTVRVLTKDGYWTLPLYQVRLEELR